MIIKLDVECLLLLVETCDVYVAWLHSPHLSVGVLKYRPSNLVFNVHYRFVVIITNMVWNN